MNIEIANRLSLYFIFPVIISCFSTLLVFNFPRDLAWQVAIYGAVPTAFMAICWLLRTHRFSISATLLNIRLTSGQRLVCYFFALLIVMAIPFDIYVNGFKLANPQSYAELYGGGRFIRHITIHCWMLIPIAFYAVRSDLRWVRVCLIFLALTFPIVTIDRNRLFIGFYCFVFCYVATRVHGVSFKKITLLCMGMFLVFAIIGAYRSGDSFIVASSGEELIEGRYPFKVYFETLPVGFQQILLYITTPIFNFVTVADSGFQTDSYLLNQLSPFSREEISISDQPQLIVPRFNVGTEFFPFLLFGGWPAVILAMLGLLTSLIASAYLFTKTSGFFAFLLFLKFSYSAIFMGFAPQFYLFLNLAFVLLLLIMSLTSFLLTRAMLFQKDYEAINEKK